MVWGIGRQIFAHFPPPFAFPPFAFPVPQLKNTPTMSFSGALDSELFFVYVLTAAAENQGAGP